MNYDIGVVIQRRVISPAESYFAIPLAGEEAAWHDLYNQALVSDSVGWVNYTIRQGIAVAAYDGGAPATGTQLRVTMTAASSTGVDFSQAWIGHKGVGDDIDFDGTQVQLLFSAAPGGTIAAAGTLVSDAVNYSFDKTKALVVTIHFDGATDVKKTEPLTNFSGAFLVDGGDISAPATDVTIGGGGYESASRLYLFSKVEVFG